VNRYLKWARANLPGAASLSDPEIQHIVKEAWRPYRVPLAVLMTIGILVVVLNDDVLVSWVVGEQPENWHPVAVVMLFGGIWGALVGLTIQTLVRQQLRKVIGNN